MTEELRRMHIALLPGDGIGPEVVAEARRVLDLVAASSRIEFVFREALIGGAAIDAAGTALPEETVAVCKHADAVLLGAVGGPKWDDPSAAVRPEQGLLGIRKALGLFANLRPVTPYASLKEASPLKPERLDGVDLIVVRELTGGIYFGEKGRDGPSNDERAFDVCSYKTTEIERIVRVAAELALARRGRLASIDKANVLETSRLWRKTTTRVVAEEFPELTVEHVLVDACAMHLIQNPSRFDVIVTENMFGDILTDETAVLAGSIGLLPSASLGVARDGWHLGLYEPIHGSAPDLAGRGVANPIGAILSAAMLLRHSFDLEREATAVEGAVSQAIANGARTRDLGGALSSHALTDVVLDHLAVGLESDEVAYASKSI